MSIEIRNESGVEVDEAALVALARHVLDGMRVHPLAELSVLLVDEAAMTGLHQRWMGEDGPTDVLAFPMDELALPHPGGTQAEHGTDDEAAETLLGDVVLCPQIAAEQARKAGHDVPDELHLLCTHGILHLLGYDHAEPEEHAAMFALQDRLLAGWQRERDAGGETGRPGRAGQDAPRREAGQRDDAQHGQHGQHGQPGGGAPGLAGQAGEG